MPALTVRNRIRRDVRSGRLTPASPLSDVHGIGPYFYARLQRALQQTNRTATIEDVWRKTRRMSTERVRTWILRVLQNERGNQCVRRTARPTSPPQYHTQDVNQHAYEALVTLLEMARDHHSTAYGSLPATQPRRTRPSQTCGCRRDQCDGPCVRTDDGGCVPRSSRTRGFVGATPHPDQRVLALTEADRRRVRNAARTRTTAATLGDPDSALDRANGHRASMRYSRRGNLLWRRPSPKVRLPV